MTEFNYWTDDRLQKRYEAEYGNRFAVVNVIAKQVRSFIKQHPTASLLDAVEYLTTGELPDKLKRREARQNVVLSDMSSVIREIDDKEIRDAVKRSVKEMKAQRHLIYQYNNITDPNAQGRVRVICNMLWHTYLI